jgi:hypothetical protein
MIYLPGCRGRSVRGGVDHTYAEGLALICVSDRYFPY